MKPRHAAALVLAGWYLMLPPPAPDGGRLIFEPLSAWKLIKRFDSKDACQQNRSWLIERMQFTMIDAARCVSDDDPYLPPEFDAGPYAAETKVSWQS
jgi:hypothetical protein